MVGEVDRGWARGSSRGCAGTTGTACHAVVGSAQSLLCCRAAGRRPSGARKHGSEQVKGMIQGQRGEGAESLKPVWSLAVVLTLTTSWPLGQPRGQPRRADASVPAPSLSDRPGPWSESRRGRARSLLIPTTCVSVSCPDLPSDLKGATRQTTSRHFGANYTRAYSASVCARTSRLARQRAPCVNR